MDKLKKKKVLFLGGSNQMVETVKTVQKMGIYSIVADSVAGAPAKMHAEASYEIDPANIKELVSIYKTQQLDGIYAMLGDVTTWNALALCKRLDVPFYLPKAQMEGSVVKAKFKDFCRTFDVAIVDEVLLTKNCEKMDVSIMEFPLLVGQHAAKQPAYAII
ncbi:biotin carboxylase [Planomicrobium sp. HSC-17F08]|nr:biotin carboxylase [Planomicrobium sp. HSC-17F08]